MYWGELGRNYDLPSEIPVESVSIWVESGALSFELKEYLQVISNENSATIRKEVAEKLFQLWLNDLKGRNNTIRNIQGGDTVTALKQDSYLGL